MVLAADAGLSPEETRVRAVAELVSLLVASVREGRDVDLNQLKSDVSGRRLGWGGVGARRDGGGGEGTGGMLGLAHRRLLGLRRVGWACAWPLAAAVVVEERSARGQQQRWSEATFPALPPLLLLLRLLGLHGLLTPAPCPLPVGVWHGVAWCDD